MVTKEYLKRGKKDNTKQRNKINERGRGENQGRERRKRERKVRSLKRSKFMERERRTVERGDDEKRES